MKGKMIVSLAIVLICFCLPSAASASLLIRGTDTQGNKLIYDTDLDITWYDFTNKYGSWDVQKAWVENLVVEFNGTSYDDWRLPQGLLTYDDFSKFYYNTDIELGHLYYTELGNPAFDRPIPNNPDLNFGVFENLVDYLYWDSLHDYTWFINHDTDVAGYCSLATGGHWINPTEQLNHAIAVRDGDVPAVTTPIPGAVWMLGSGLASLIGTRLGKRAKTNNKASREK